MNKFLLSINLIWLFLFVAALNSRDVEYLRWFGLWTYGMIGFGIGCAYKEQQSFDDVWQKELERLAAREAHQEQWEDTHPGWCGRCGAAKKNVAREG